MKQSPINTTLLFLAIGLLIGATACVKEYDPGFSEHEPQLVINAVFSTDTTIIASLSQSKSITSSADLTTLGDAVVELYEEGVKIEELEVQSKTDTNYVYSSQGQSIEINTVYSYHSNVQAVAGKTYAITASKAGFQTVRAESTMPNDLQADNIKLSTEDLREETDEFGQTRYTGSLYVDIDDVAGEENFYEFKLYYTFIDTLFSGEVNIQRYQEYITVSEGTGESTFSDEFSLDAPPEHFSDIGFDGTTKRFVISEVSFYNQPSSNVQLDLEVRSLSKDYYNYYSSYNKHSYNEGNFLAEPVTVYNNVENGYGVFAGYTVLTLPLFLF